MLTWAQPYWLLLIVPVSWLAWRARYSLPAGWSGGQALRHPLARLMRLSTAPLHRLAYLHNGLVYLGLVCLVLALARPQWQGSTTEDELLGRELVLLIDTSKTMSISDFEAAGRPIERLAVLKQLVDRFVEARQGDRFGVIVFGSFAATLVPPTFDRELVRAMVNRVQVGVAGDDTALGDAVGLALKQLDERAELRPALVLFTDGDNTAGQLTPADATDLARSRGIPVYTVEIRPPTGESGAAPRDVPDPHAYRLADMAKSTGGRHYVAGNRDTLQAVIADIGQREQRVSRPPLNPAPREWYIVPLVGGALLLALARLTLLRKVVA